VAAQLDVVNRLTAYGRTLRILGAEDTTAKMFLLELKSAENELTVRSYIDIATANEEYRALEEATERDAGTDVVLVSVESLSTLKRAYPNYFLDTTAFLGTVNDAMS
jgi:hypothetical protein